MSDRLSNLLRARRMFDVLTAEDAPKAARHLQDGQLRGAFIETERPKALYIDGDRGTRRHEVMHGMRWAASQNPELQSVLPWWARGAERGSFRDELLARLASKREGDLLEWDLGRYAEMEPQAAAAYRAAKPVQSVARFAYDHPSNGKRPSRRHSSRRPDIHLWDVRRREARRRGDSRPLRQDD